MPSPAQPQADILVVDDDPALIQLMLRLLDGMGRIRVATRPDQALLLAVEQAPDLVLLDAEMPGMSGFEVCEALKAEPGLADVPIIFVTAHAEPAFEVAGFAAGAADFIAKPVHAELLRARVQAQLQVKRMGDRLRRLARRDPLTELPNRVAFDEALQREWRRALRKAAPTALLRVELDGFDGYAAHFGDAAANQALIRIGTELARICARPADTVARWDGPGFAILLPDTDREGAQRLGFHLLDGVEALAIAHPGAVLARHLTISLGLGWYAGDGEDEHREPALAADAGAAAPWTPAQIIDAASAAVRSAQQAGGAQAWSLAVDADPTQAVEFPAALRAQRRR